MSPPLAAQDPVRPEPFAPRVRGWAVACGILLAAPLAHAEGSYPSCDRTPTEADTAAAKGAFQAGQASFNEADYPRAILYWEDAYRRDCTAHALLLNLGRAYELNGEKEQAVVALETFLQRSPGSPQNDQVERRIERLKEQIEAEATGTESSPKPVPGGESAGGNGNGDPSGAIAADATFDATPPSGGTRSIVPLVVAGAGGLIAVVGGIVHLGARSDLNEYREICPNNFCPNDTIEEEAMAARSRVTTTGFITAGGALIGAGGLAWYFLSKPSGAPAAAASNGRRPDVTPLVGPDFAGLSVSGRF